MVWLVERLRFDETIRQFKPDDYREFKNDEELLKFIKEVMSGAGLDYLWRITKVYKKNVRR